jgi:hypothetical protein
MYTIVVYKRKLTYILKERTMASNSLLGAEALEGSTTVLLIIYPDPMIPGTEALLSNICWIDE